MVDEVRALDACRRGASDRAAALCEELRGELVAYARRRVGSAAEDVVADAIIATLKALANGRGPDDHLRRYLYAVVRNGCTRQAARERHVLGVMEGLLTDRAAPAPHQVESPDDGTDRLFDAMASLTAEQRTVLWLVVVEGWSRDEVAQHLGISPQAVSSSTYRAKVRLRDLVHRATLVGPADIPSTA